MDENDEGIESLLGKTLSHVDNNNEEETNKWELE